MCSVGPLLRQYAIVITVNLGMLCMGMSLGWSSPVLVKLGNATQTVFSEPLSAFDGSWIVSSSFLAAAIGIILPPYLLDNLGRKYSVILSCVPHMIGCVIFVFATQIWLFLLGRVLVGIGLTLIFSVAPTYASEIASKEVRGALGTIFQISCCIGMTLMLSIGPFVSYSTLSIMYAVVVIITVLPVFFIPDSPYYLYSKGKVDSAIKILIKIRGSEAFAKHEIAEYKFADSDKKTKRIDLMKDRVFLKSVALVMIFAALGQFSGSNVIAYYLQPVLDSTQTNISSEIASVIIGCMKIVACLVTACITDRFGRKPILVWTYIGMAIGMVGLGTYFHIKLMYNNQLTGFVNYVPLLCITLVILCNNAGQSSLFFTVTAEMFEGPSRALGVTSAQFSGAFFNFVTAQYLTSLLEAVGAAATYWGFGVVCILSGGYVAVFLPETKGKTFAEIQRNLGRKRDEALDLNS